MLTAGNTHHPPSAGQAEPSAADAKLLPKRRPKFVVEAVTLLAGNTSEGKVGLGGWGQYLKRTDLSFSSNAYGYSGLLSMLKTYDLLTLRQEEGGQWSVSLAARPETSEHA